MSTGEPTVAEISGSSQEESLACQDTAPVTRSEDSLHRRDAIGPQMCSEHPCPVALIDRTDLIWNEDLDAVDNYVAVGQRLGSCGDLYRATAYASGLLLGSVSEHVLPMRIERGTQLASIVVDRLRVRRIKNGKPSGSGIPSSHLNTMLCSEAFLQQFRPVDLVTRLPVYIGEFQQVRPGYNDAGRGQRILYLGDEPVAKRIPETITEFLDVMPFATNADRTNALAAALTVKLRNHWLGAKPLLLATATKSHAGKETVISFATGNTRATSISYQATDWALERAFVGCLKHEANVGLVIVDNARLPNRVQHIASGFLERFITDPEPVLFSTGTGNPVRRPNDIVVALSSNFGSVSEDLLNRALPIHLAPVGNIADRKSPIGNPKLDFLPRNRDVIEAELRGMIEHWRDAGRPRCNNAPHAFSDWAAVIGGILQVSGFSDFLANYSLRRTVDDPLRRGLGLVGAARPNEWLTPSALAAIASALGLSKIVIPAADQHSESARQRGIGVVLSAHEDETFEVESDDERLSLTLEKARRRFENGEISTRYRFRVVTQQAIPEDPTDGGTLAQLQCPGDASS